MMKCISAAVVILFLRLASEARPGSDEWTLYKQKYGKEYLDLEEDNMRMNIYMEKKKLIEEFNREESEKRGFTMGINHLSDLTVDEFNIMNGYRRNENYKPKNSPDIDEYIEKTFNNKSWDVPDKLDWREVPGRVSKVKYQGLCGSCWAFSAIGALEGQELTHNMTSLVGLSVQSLVDCDYVHAMGCGGGDPFGAFDFINQVGGVEQDTSYPYIADMGSCHFDEDKVVFTDKGGMRLPTMDENLLKRAVAISGPVSVAVSANDDMANYQSGIYKGNGCQNNMDALNHAVLIVGYGTDPVDGDFWIVKNSWGKRWGEKGYIRMARNVNQCGIALAHILPTF